MLKVNEHPGILLRDGSNNLLPCYRNRYISSLTVYPFRINVVQNFSVFFVTKIF